MTRRITFGCADKPSPESADSDCDHLHVEAGSALFTGGDAPNDEDATPGSPSKAARTPASAAPPTETHARRRTVRFADTVSEAPAAGAEQPEPPEPEPPQHDHRTRSRSAPASARVRPKGAEYNKGALLMCETTVPSQYARGSDFDHCCEYRDRCGQLCGALRRSVERGHAHVHRLLWRLND